MKTQRKILAHVPLTWGDLADLYDAYHDSGRRARTRPMESVADWAAKHTAIFYIDKDDNFLLHETRILMR